MDTLSEHYIYQCYLCVVVVQSPNHVWLFVTPWNMPGEVCPSSCTLHQWFHPAISSSDAFFSFCLSICILFYIYIYAAAAAKSLQSCPTLCDPIDSSPPGSAVPGILQARMLEWVAIPFSMNSLYCYSITVMEDDKCPRGILVVGGLGLFRDVSYHLFP